MTVEQLIDYGFLDFVGYKNGLYYLEFVYSYTVHSNSWGSSDETYNYIGTIICNGNGDIYKCVVKSYAIVHVSAKIIVGFPQIINKTSNLNLNDLFKIDDNDVPYIDMIAIKEIVDNTVSSLWVNYLKGRSFYTVRIRQSNVCTKEYIEETQDRIKTAEFFENEKEKFNILANSIISGSKNIENGLGYVAGSLGRGLGHLAEVHKYDAGNDYIARH